MKRLLVCLLVCAACCTSVVVTRGADEPKRKVLYYSFSQGFEHGPVKLAADGGPSASDKALIEIGKAHNVEVVCTKDGRVFDGDLKPYAAFAFYVTGDLLKDGKDDHPEKSPSRPMTQKGYDNFVAAIRGGKGLLGFHAATDARLGDDKPGEVNPYTQLIGARFVAHGKQQDATLLIVDEAFPVLKPLGKSFSYFDEWYAMKDFNPDMRVVLVQDTKGMDGDCYKRPPYPATWVRAEGKGRVLYCSMGHNDNFFTDAETQKAIWEGLSWTMGDFSIDTKSNFKTVTPDAELKK
ncbi:MAG: ThuA domain-containing protein [Thermoguttaceae bacterium]